MISSRLDWLENNLLKLGGGAVPMRGKLGQVGACGMWNVGVVIAYSSPALHILI